jgi:hypothetical protein
VNLSSINIDSAAGVFTGDPCLNLGGSFDNCSDNNIFKAVFGGDFGPISFGDVAQRGLDELFLINDLSAMGTRFGGGDLGAVDLIYVPRGLWPDGVVNDNRTSIIYEFGTGRIAVDASDDVDLMEISIESVSKSEIFTTCAAAQNLDGSFDFCNETTIFKTRLNGSFGSLNLGNVAGPDLAERFLLDDLRVVGKFADGRALGDVDLIYRVENSLPTISAIPPRHLTDEDTPVGPIAFTVSDMETPANDLSVHATSSNVALVPVRNVVFAGTGADRSVTITPAANRFGQATITLGVTDSDGGSRTRSLTIDFFSVNDLPEISISEVLGVPIKKDEPPPPIFDIDENASAVVSFSVSDVETSVADLKVTKTSSDTTLVPLRNIVLSGSGANRTASIFPSSNQVGTTTITLSVEDMNDPPGQSSVSFELMVHDNDGPTIKIKPPIDQCTEVNSPTDVISFTVDDADTPANLLALMGSSAPSIVSDFAFGGSGKDRTVIITPAPNQTGTTTIRITVRDAQGLTATEEFALTIAPFRPQPGDANMDSQFDQLDLVQVLQAAKYQTGRPATFAEGDWNGDGVFDPRDVVLALQTGSYLQGPYRTTSCDTAPIL